MTILAQSAAGPWTFDVADILIVGIVGIFSIVGFILWKPSQPNS